MKKLLYYPVIVVILLMFLISTDMCLAQIAMQDTRTLEIVVDASHPIGPVPEVFTPGILSDPWPQLPYPFLQEINKLHKKPAWRLGIGIGGGFENLEKEPASQEEWNRFYETVREQCRSLKQNYPGKIILSTADMVPRWLSKHPNDEKPFGDTKWAAPWKFTVPSNYEKWSDIIMRVVKIHEECGLNADYIILDEPDWMLYSTEEEAFETYSYAARAIKRVNQNIKVGALGFSGWGAKKSTIPGQSNMDVAPYNHTMLKGFIDYIGRHPDLPVDFIDWHFSNPDNTDQEVQQTRKWINESWPKDKAQKVFFTIGEGVYSSKKDYEAREGGASSLILKYAAYAKAGVRRFTATSLTDQCGTWISGDWCYVGFLSDQTRHMEGIIRPKWNAFKLLDKLDGQLLPITLPNIDNSSFAAIASENSSGVAVLLANHPSGPGKNIRTCLEAKGYSKEDVKRLHLPIEEIKQAQDIMSDLTEDGQHDEIIQRITKQLKNMRLSPKMRDDMQFCINQGIGTAKEYLESRNATLKFTHLKKGNYLIKTYLVDRDHSNSYRFNKQNNGIIDKEIQTALEQVKISRENAIKSSLRTHGYSESDIDAIIQQVKQELDSSRSGKQATQKMLKEIFLSFLNTRYQHWDRYKKNGGSLDNIKLELVGAIKEGQSAYKSSLHNNFYPKMNSINQMKGVSLETVNEKKITIRENENFIENISVPPYSVLMLELQKMSD